MGKNLNQKPKFKSKLNTFYLVFVQIKILINWVVSLFDIFVYVNSLILSINMLLVIPNSMDQFIRRMDFQGNRLYHLSIVVPRVGIKKNYSAKFFLSFYHDFYRSLTATSIDHWILKMLIFN